MNLEGAKVILTGGSSGIGKETAKQLISKGAKVLITGRNAEKLERVAAEIGAIPFASDIANLDTIPEAAKECVELLGGNVDVLINNAGIGTFPKLGEITVQDLENVYRTNVFGLVLFTQEIVKYFVSQENGNIINIGSSASLKGFPQGTVYASSKFAVRGITQCWQGELRKHNIRVVQLNPSEVASAFAQENREEREEQVNKLGPKDIAHTMISVLEMRDKGFVPEVNVWATNPF